jgi:hypothetical protein
VKRKSDEKGRRFGSNIERKIGREREREESG